MHRTGPAHQVCKNPCNKPRRNKGEGKNTFFIFFPHDTIFEKESASVDTLPQPESDEKGNLGSPTGKRVEGTGEEAVLVHFPLGAVKWFIVSKVCRRWNPVLPCNPLIFPCQRRSQLERLGLWLPETARTKTTINVNINKMTDGEKRRKIRW